MFEKVANFMGKRCFNRNNMQKYISGSKVAALLGIMLILTGCSDAREVSGSINGDVAEEKETSIELNQTAYKEINTESDSASNKEISIETNGAADIEYIGNAPLEVLTNFSEGRALVQFVDYSEVTEDDVKDAIEASAGSDEDKMDYFMQHWKNFQGINRVALIDNKGKILWKSEYTMADTALREVSDFRDGLACFIFDGNNKSSYFIIDSNGNITFTKDFSENFMILGGGDGLFLTAEHNVGISIDEWQIGVIDKNGNVVVPYKAYVLDAPPEEPVYVEAPKDCSSEIEGILDALEQLEAERQAWLEECWAGDIGIEDFENTLKIEEEFEMRRRELLEEKEQLEAEYTDQFDQYANYQQELDWYQDSISHYSPGKISFDMDSDSCGYGYYSSCTYLGENIYKLNYTYGFVVLDMNTQNIISLDDEFMDKNIGEDIVIDFPEYQGQQEYTYGQFHNGYAVKMIMGMDQSAYFTVIDEEGNSMFEPKAGFDDAYVSGDGKYFTALTGGSLTVFDISGNPLTSIDCSNISPLRGSDYIGSTAGYNMHDGVIRFDGNHGFYVNIEDGTIIGSTYITADDISVTIHQK